MRAARIGIRGKILVFFGLALLGVVALEVVAQGAALRAGREFEERLARYHAIQGMRSSLAEARTLSERYMRERLPEQLESVETSLTTLSGAASALVPNEEDSREAFFEERAVRRGLEAWIPALRDAVSRRLSDDPEAYNLFLKADKVGAYVDGYLGKLLSLAMAFGSERYREIVERSEVNRRLAIAVILGAGTLAMALAALFAASIAAPIRRLAEATERMAAGDLEVDPVIAATGDEVEILARGFNAMSANIRALVEGLKEKAELERLLHEAQFMNLQDQIRPHFLFNALNTISRSALFEDAPKTEKLAGSLGKLLRYSLSEGGALVSLGEELAVLREYLSFQVIRFGSRLRWEIRSDGEVETLAIPRFTLQPIVENAVRHGIEPKEEGGTVLVSARRKGDKVRLVVADSGVGMRRELLERLRAAAAGILVSRAGNSAAPGDGAAGIGMANLESRLAYRYAEGARLAIASRPGRGTVVRITLPMEAARGI
ncbi:MAG: sensor histidine kinase [Spirochaetaceae bacterium]|nr:sensor histidine kinase [Spirochaetaceae bacterium]